MVTNSCWSTSISALTFTPNTQPFEITDGQTGSVTFGRPANGVEQSVNIPMICGTTSYAVYQDNQGTPFSANWLSISPTTSPATFKLNVDTTVSLDLIALQNSVTYTVYIKSTLDDYASVSRFDTFQIQINKLTCDCQYVRWTAPSVAARTAPVAATTTVTIPLPTVDNSLKTSVAAYQTCFDSSDLLQCNVAGAFLAASLVKEDGSAIPTWMVFDHVNGQVAVSPTAGSQNGVYKLKVTWTSTESVI